VTKDMTDLKALIAQLADGRTLSREQASLGFEIMMSGNATPSQMGAFLMAMRVRGETIEEITAAAVVMRARAAHIAAPADAIDVVGTGGDAVGTHNISTATALVVAACGVPVAKHGNRALSSRSGTADALTALGVNIECPFPLIERAIAEARIGFMMAPRHHSAMKHVAGTRVELGTRTIFNLLGPLANPAGVRRQLVGVFDPKWVEPIARAFGNLGSTKAWVVHGAGGVDELSTVGESQVAEYFGGAVRTFTVTPEDAGLPRAPLADLKGGAPHENAHAIRALLDGVKGPLRDVVLLNAAGALMIADKVASLREGAALAAKAIDSGAARDALARLVAITNSAAPAK
jgi:anthranilate phosphoribosyltransferase